MKSLTNLAVTLTRLTRHLIRNKREVVIVTTVLTGVFLQWLLFRNDNQLTHQITNSLSDLSTYQVHLTINFIKSCLMSILCYWAVAITSSVRIVVLMLFLITSIFFDLMSLFSTDFYYLIKPFRYEINYNFKDLYSVFEIISVFFTFLTYLVDRLEIPAFTSQPDSIKVNRKSIASRDSKTKNTV